MTAPPGSAPPAGLAFERDDWWDKRGAFRLLHDINPLRLRLTQEQAGGTLHGKQLLDVGCGGGIFSEAAAKAGAIVCGMDTTEKAIAAARAHAESGGLDIRYHCARQLGDLPAQQYNIITCFEVLEHVAEPPLLVADIADRLAPHGVAVFSTINRSLRAWGLMIAALEHVLHIIPPGTHHYRDFIKPEELARWCRHNALAVTEVCGLTYSFFGHYYRLDPRDTRVNYFLVARRQPS